MKKDKFCDIYEWMPIKDFTSRIFLKSGEIVSILEVKPINFKLKSEIEQMSILEAYKRFLKQCNFDIQIVVQTYKTNVKEHLKNIEKYSYGNEKLKNIMQSYVGLIRDIIGDNRSITRRFFIVIRANKNIEECIDKVKNGLSACGNEVIECDIEILEDILKSYFCKRNICEE